MTPGSEETDAYCHHLGNACKSVAGLFDAFNVLCRASHLDIGEARGRISTDLQDNCARRSCSARLTRRVLNAPSVDALPVAARVGGAAGGRGEQTLLDSGLGHRLDG
jgi:hypothetical protein